MEWRSKLSSVCIKYYIYGHQGEGTTEHVKLRSLNEVLSQFSSGSVALRAGRGKQSLLIVLGKVPLLLLVLLVALSQPQLEWSPRHLETEVRLLVTQETRVRAVGPGVSSVTVHCNDQMQLIKI